MSQEKKTQKKTGKAQATSIEEEADTGPTTKECLKEISSKLSIVIETLNTLNKNFDDWKNQTSVNDDRATNTNADGLGEALTQIKEVLEKVTMPDTQASVSHAPDLTNNQIEGYALRIKNKLSRIWENNIQSRRLLYWQALRNRNLATKFEEWLQEDPVIIPQWAQMKAIQNEPESITQRREKQVMDNLKTEKELLILRSECQETKYKEIDTKMISEIEKQVTGQCRNFLVKMWQDDCKRNEEISEKRWTTKNQSWLNKYEETFKEKHQNKNPYIKIIDTNEKSMTYAEAAAKQPPVRKRQSNAPGNPYRRNTSNDKRPSSTNERQQRSQIRSQGVRQPSPASTSTNHQEEGLNGNVGRLRSPTPTPENQGTSSQNPIDIDYDTTIIGNSTQLHFLGRGQGRVRGRGRSRGRGRYRGSMRRPPII